MDPLALARAVLEALSDLSKVYLDLSQKVKEAEIKLKLKVEAMQPSAPPDRAPKEDP